MKWSLKDFWEQSLTLKPISGGSIFLLSAVLKSEGPSGSHYEIIKTGATETLISMFTLHVGIKQSKDITYTHILSTKSRIVQSLKTGRTVYLRHSVEYESTTTVYEEIGNIHSLQWCHNESDGISSHQPHDCSLNRLFTKAIDAARWCFLRVNGLCEGNSPVTGELPGQRTSNAENVSIWWRHHVEYISRIMHMFFLFVAVWHWSIDQCHKSQNGPVPYPTMLHSVQKCAHFCSEWHIVGYGTSVLLDLYPYHLELFWWYRGINGWTSCKDQ